MMMLRPLKAFQKKKNNNNKIEMFLFPFPHSPEWLIVDLPKQNLNRILPGYEPRLFVFADQARCLSQYHTAKGFTRKMYLELVYS